MLEPVELLLLLLLDVPEEVLELLLFELLESEESELSGFFMAHILIVKILEAICTNSFLVIYSFGIILLPSKRGTSQESTAFWAYPYQ